MTTHDQITDLPHGNATLDVNRRDFPLNLYATSQHLATGGAA
jgi:hypothetical protein